MTAEEALEQNKAQILKQRGQGQELKDYYCKTCRKLTDKLDMIVDKDGYYLCKDH